MIEIDFMNGEPLLAVVIPFFNEERNVGLVCRELRSLLEAELADVEVTLIDDGSCDRTGENLDEIAKNWPNCRVFHLPANQGQSAALLFGFSRTTAPIIVTMDGDGQNDARDIPRLLARLEDADMVVGARVERQDSWMRRRISRIANRARSGWLGDGVSDAGCALKVFRREVVSAFIPIRTLYSFMPSLAVAAGFRVVEAPVSHRPRAHGRSKYSVRSFLLLPIVDFIGLGWFSSRRCRAGSLLRNQSISQSPASRWPTSAFWFLLICVGVLSGILLQRKIAGPAARRVSLARAERIALKQVPHGTLGAELLRQADGHLRWQIDVQLPHSRDFDEVGIDAMDGHVLAVQRESAEEERFEMAAEDRPAKATPRPPW